MVRLSPEQERVSSLISDTVSLLCRNGLQFKSELKVQGLLGISLDNEVFLVQIEKRFGEVPSVKLTEGRVGGSQAEHSQNDSDSNDLSGSETISRKHRPRKRRRTPSPPAIDSSKVIIKREPGLERESVLSMMKADTSHDKNSMQESYKEVVDTSDYDKPFIQKALQNASQSVNTGQPIGSQSDLDDPGCSTWDDPLGALTSATEDNSVTSKADDVDIIGDDTLDPQAMSTMSPVVQTSRLGYHVDQDGWPLDSDLHDALSCGVLPSTDRRFSYRSNDASQWIEPWSGSSSRQQVGQLHGRHGYLPHPGPTGRTNVGDPTDASSLVQSLNTKSSKMVVCQYPECDKVYANHQNALRHQKRDHGRRQFEKGLYFTTKLKDLP